MEDEAVGDELVELGLDLGGKVSFVGDVGGGVDLEKVGGEALDADGGVGTLLAGQVLADARLEIPEGANGVGP